jgi:hypothetical protein
MLMICIINLFINTLTYMIEIFSPFAFCKTHDQFVNVIRKLRDKKQSLYLSVYSLYKCQVL